MYIKSLSRTFWESLVFTSSWFSCIKSKFLWMYL
jgi:hypothetical protein